MPDHPAPGLVISAPHSGAGKTTVTLGVLAALRARGVRVSAAKVGPDYIDPAFHERAVGRPSVNLDGWAMPHALLDALASRAAEDADLVVCEGAMGLFDGTGHRGAVGDGSTADVAARTGWPVVLVVDARGASQSVAALVLGFRQYRPDVRLAGVILNRVGSDRHRTLIGDALDRLGVAVLGCLPRDGAVALPERHLGLVQAAETDDIAEKLAALGRLAEATIDLDALMAAAAPARAGANDDAPPPPPPPLPPLGQRIAVARDLAFTFAYPHALEGWWRAGAEIVPFSPLADETPPDDADAVFLPGGYPELHAGRLAAASRFQRGLRAFAAARPVYGECGGFMVLGETLEDADGVAHPMAGLLGVRTSYAKRKMTLGYRRVVLLDDGPLGAAGQRFAGHEFHYSVQTRRGGDAPLFSAAAADGRDLGALGARRGLVAGSYIHLIARHDEEAQP